MNEPPIVRAKVWGRYREFELLSVRGKQVSVRLLGTNPGSNQMADYWTVNFSSIHPNDRHFCIDPNFEEGEFTAMFLCDVYFSAENKKFVFCEGKVMHLRNLLKEGGMLIVPSKKFGEIPLPLNALEIKKREKHA